MFEEPEKNPLEDTQPTGTFPTVDPNEVRKTDNGRRIVGLIFIFGIIGFILAAVALLSSTPPAPEQNQVAAQVTPTTDDSAQNAAQDAAQDAAQNTVQETLESTPEDTEPEPTSAPDDNETQDEAPSADVFLLPTLDPEGALVLLSQPLENLNTDNPAQISRNVLDPFTTIPDRPRDQVIEYTIQRGDTVYDIAQRFGLEQESIAWSNDRRSLWTLTPGSTLKIPPVDGAVHVAVGRSTIAEIAALYQVNDPLIITDSEYNNLRGLGPDFVPPSGMEIFIPGGVAEAVDWSPPALETAGSSGPGGTSDPNLVSFESGAAGSCGLVERGAGTAWGSPMTPGTYTVTRGFSSFHQGIDLAASPGAPVYAANGGRVIFAGRSNWGYGLAVVISHGPYTTLYGHLSVINTSCNQIVNQGQLIGGVGSTGNSSGPHLHFEIMYGNARSNPAATLPF